MIDARVIAEIKRLHPRIWKILSKAQKHTLLQVLAGEIDKKLIDQALRRMKNEPISTQTTKSTNNRQGAFTDLREI